MNDKNLTDRELILAVDNDPAATPREKELADRLDAATTNTTKMEAAYHNSCI